MCQQKSATKSNVSAVINKQAHTWRCLWCWCAQSTTRRPLPRSLQWWPGPAPSSSDHLNWMGKKIQYELSFKKNGLCRKGSGHTIMNGWKQEKTDGNNSNEKETTHSYLHSGRDKHCVQWWHRGLGSTTLNTGTPESCLRCRSCDAPHGESPVGTKLNNKFKYKWKNSPCVQPLS